MPGASGTTTEDTIGGAPGDERRDAGMTDPADDVHVVGIDPGDFVRDTDVTEVAPGRYTAALPEAWRVIYAFGGVSMAVAVRAIQRALDRPDLDLLSANALFCSAVPCTSYEIEADVLRSGRTGAQGRSSLRVAGSDEVGIAATATFGALDHSPLAYTDLVLPEDAGRPDDVESPPPRSADDPFPAIPFHDQTDWRPAIGTRWWDDEPNWQPGPALTGAWHRLVVEPRLPDGTFDPLALCVPGDSLGSSIGQRLGPPDDDADNFFTVTLELSIDVFARQETPWVFSYVRAPVAGDGYGWGTVELFGESGTLLAVARQRARLRRFRHGDGFFSGG